MPGGPAWREEIADLWEAREQAPPPPAMPDGDEMRAFKEEAG